MTTTPSGLGSRNQELPKEEWTVDNLTGKKTVKVGDISFPPRKVWMRTYGCQMNYHDTERVLSHLENLNFSKAETPADKIAIGCALSGKESNNLVIPS